MGDASVVSLSHLVRLLGFQASKVQVWQQGTLYSFRLEEDLQGLPSSSSQKGVARIMHGMESYSHPFLPNAPITS